MLYPQPEQMLDDVGWSCRLHQSSEHVGMPSTFCMINYNMQDAELFVSCLKEATPVPHNGCRPRKRPRG
ncbi:MAG: hypothetical protein Q8755_03360 [Candidatus Phytoplasma australasiaticum]|nr:hypothetical protein [Candidatus Phytoplasma australasiaticum]